MRPGTPTGHSEGRTDAYGGAAAASLLAAEVVEDVPRLALRVRYPPEDVGVVYAALGLTLIHI